MLQRAQAQVSSSRGNQGGMAGVQKRVPLRLVSQLLDDGVDTSFILS